MLLHAFLVLGLDPGLVDKPISATSLTYLDSGWTATQSGGSPLGCTFTEDTDLKPAGGSEDSGTEMDNVPDANSCCELCWKEGTCAAAVWQASKQQCWLKSATDMAGGSYARSGRTTCVRKYAAAARGVSIPASVPGDLLTDLQKAGQVGDPLYEKNWLNSTIWHSFNWTYSTTFTMSASALARAGGGGAGSVRLVFDGIKMGAAISLNGVLLGTAADQFLRYEYKLDAATHRLRAAGNKLDVTFDPSIPVGGRFMACTGGWDWAPYSHTLLEGAHTLSKGIWKAVYLAEVAASSASIDYVVPQIKYSGAYPTTPLTEGAHGGFDVAVRVHFTAAVATSGTLHLSTGWGAASDVKLELPEGRSNRTIATKAAAADVKLWWPAGMGAQPLYGLNVTFTPAGSTAGGDGAGAAASVSASRRVGFRYFALVSGNDTDPSFVQKAAGMEGSGEHGMFWRVNGAPILSRGANMIPMEELEGRMEGEAHTQLVRSAVDGGFNTLRVWGGGMFLPDAWYDACDELGILVYHDMQYAQSGHAPANEPTQEAELRHQVRRLSSHASIVLWDGCNECQVKMGTPTAIYATFVMTVVSEEDKSRAVWPSCPAPGWKTGVRMLDAIPTGSTLTTPDSAKTHETHGPYQHGTGFPAVNGASDLQLFDANIPIKVTPVPTGPQHENVFASEFGAVVTSSFESMSVTLAPEHWGLHAGQPKDTCQGGFASQCAGVNVMAERNYPCDSLIDVYFGKKDESYFNSTGEAIFKRQLYQCQLSQALEIKSNIETRRSQNELGIIVWQYNEIWPTGGWGSIEYGTAVPGQVRGGRWKPLQYLYRRSIYADVMAACGDGGSCYIKNDATVPFAGNVTVTALDVSSGEAATLKTLSFAGAAALAAGAGTSHFFTVDLSGVSGATHILGIAIKEDAATERPGARVPTPAGLRSFLPAGEAAGEAAATRELSFNEQLLAPPQELQLKKASVGFKVAQAPNADGSVDITVTTDAVALYITFTTLAHGRFSDNAFALAPSCSPATIQFVPFGALDAGLLASSLRVEHLQQALA